MANPRRTWSSNTTSQSIENQNPFQSQTQTQSQSILFFLKKPQAFPFLLSFFLLLTWLSLRLQNSSRFSSPPQFHASTHTRDEEDLNANLVRFPSAFPSQITRDKRGWLLDPITLARDASISGGAKSCASIHVGEIRPGGVRGNHRHHDCNETLVIWGADTLFRLENTNVVGKGYAEVRVGAGEVAVAVSPSGTAHALRNVDPVRVTFFIGCQDNIISYSNSSTDFNVWKDF
ncbi:hypothetical protein RJ641_009654 [Dillenia turbinata]|uniref:Cupin type-1 domain-containing protein n=1 Tax=Dillenia turbinata TaxID=194707 RepID=A0AAN8UYH4_9MAGN